MGMALVLGELYVLSTQCLLLLRLKTFAKFLDLRPNLMVANHRPIIAINGQWPSPTIEANVGDDVAVTVNNNLGNQVRRARAPTRRVPR
jgi:Multicopper oxidase